MPATRDLVPGLGQRRPGTRSRALEDNARYRVSSLGWSVHMAIARLDRVTDVPRLEAEVLLAHVLGTSRTKLLSHPEQTLSGTQLNRFDELVRMRATSYPLPYLIGKKEFCGLDYEVTPDVLIPRPETEMLVELSLAQQPVTVVDVGTGSGCIAISLAVQLPSVIVYAIDVSPAAIAVAHRNAVRHDVADRVHLVVGDVLTSCPGLSDLIVSNPPYVSAGEVSSLPASVRNYEPWLALDGGPEGLGLIRRVLVQAPTAMRLGGRILIEIGAGQGDGASSLARTFFPKALVRVHRDLAGKHRVLEVQT